MDKMTRMVKHHIIPKNRGGTDYNYNVAYVTDREHKDYHNLFSNKTPYEIIRYLNREFWNYKYSKLEDIASEIEAKDNPTNRRVTKKLNPSQDI